MKFASPGEKLATRSPMVPALIVCGTCGQAQEARLEALRPGQALECCRCGALLVEHKRASLSTTTALALAALVLYVPANLYPILRMNWYGAYSQNTVWDGVVSLARSNQWAVALIVFLAS